jgi:hypothetical protein
MKKMQKGINHTRQVDKKMRIGNITNKKMIGITTYLSITLNVNDFYSPIKRH